MVIKQGFKNEKSSDRRKLQPVELAAFFLSALLLTGCIQYLLPPLELKSHSPGAKRLETMGKTLKIQRLSDLDAIRKGLSKDENIYVYKWYHKVDPIKNEPICYYEAVILKNVSDDKFIVLTQLEAPNYSLTNRDMRKRFAKWHTEYGAILYGAFGDALYLRFTKLDKARIDKLVDEILKFCPDIESTGGVDHAELRHRLLTTGECDFWWD